jgi:hypothetical protein
MLKNVEKFFEKNMMRGHGPKREQYVAARQRPFFDRSLGAQIEGKLVSS